MEEEIRNKTLFKLGLILICFSTAGWGYIGGTINPGDYAGFYLAYIASFVSGMILLFYSLELDEKHMRIKYGTRNT